MTSIFPGGNALNAANITNKQQNQSAELMEKISNGKRLMTGADDAGNINKVNNLKAKVLSTKAAIRSVTDIMSMAQLGDQGYKNINKMLLRANELALQSTNKIYKDADRISLNKEIQNIINEIDNIAISEQYESIKATVSENIVDDKINLVFEIEETTKFFVEKINQKELQRNLP